MLPCLVGTLQVSRGPLTFVPGCTLQLTESLCGREEKSEGADRGRKLFKNNVKQAGASPAAAGGVEVMLAEGNALRLPEIYCSLGRFSQPRANI